MSSTVAWSGLALVPETSSTRESTIEGLLDHAEYFERSRIVIDRSFESAGFRGAPFLRAPGSEQLLSIESDHAALWIAFESEALDGLRVVERFVPHFFLDTTVPGIDEPVRYTLVCKGGTGRLRIGREGITLRGDLMITIACRTYVSGTERDESEVQLSGGFRVEVE